MEIIRSDFAMETEMESGVTSGAQSARGYAAVSTNPLNSLRNIGTELRYAGPDRLPIKQEGAFFFLRVVMVKNGKLASAASEER